MKLALILPMLLLLCPPRPCAAADTTFGLVAGRVYADSGEALDDAQVRLTRLDPDLGALSYSTMRSARVLDDGAFEFSRVEPGTYLVDAQCGERWLPLPVKITLATDTDRVTDLALSLRKGASIEGRVLDELGRPLSGVGVGVGDAGLQGGAVEPVIVVDHVTGEASALGRGLTYPRLPLATAFTAADGRFRLAPVLPASSASLRVGGLAEYFDTTISGIVVRSEKTSFVDVTLKRAAAILGRATLADGRPAAGARVTLRTIECEPQNRTWIVLTKSDELDLDSSNVSATTISVEREGLFRFDGLTPGRYLLRASAPGMATYTSSVLLVSRDAETVHAAVTFEPARTLSGRVVDVRGTTPRSGIVRVLTDESVPKTLQPFVEPIEAALDADGAFSFAGLGRGPYALEIICDGYRTELVEGVAHDQHDLEIAIGTYAPMVSTSQVAILRKSPTKPAKPTSKSAKAKLAKATTRAKK